MKHLFKTIVAVLAASLVLFACSSKQSPVKDLTDFADNLEQASQNFTEDDWTNAISTLDSLQQALNDHEFTEEEIAATKEAETKIFNILANSKDSFNDEAKAKYADAVASSKTLLNLMGITDDSLYVELEEEEPLDLDAIANEFAAEAEEAAAKDVAEADAVPFTVVEEKPSFDGGDANKFSKWVAKNVVYPESAKENETEGRVILQFVVNETGAVEDVRVIKGVSEDIDAEAIRVVSSSPAWTPGKQNGTPVKVKYTFPVIFAIR